MVRRSLRVFASKTNRCSSSSKRQAKGDMSNAGMELEEGYRFLDAML